MYISIPSGAIKSGRNSNVFKFFSISIPSGAIKRILTRTARSLTSLISIPSGAIKSIRISSELGIDPNISIPSGAIKSIVSNVAPAVIPEFQFLLVRLREIS